MPEPEDLPTTAVSSAPSVDNDEADDEEADDAAHAAFTGGGDDMDVDCADAQIGLDAIDLVIEDPTTIKCETVCEAITTSSRNP